MRHCGQTGTSKAQPIPDRARLDKFQQPPNWADLKYRQSDLGEACPLLMMTFSRVMGTWAAACRTGHLGPFRQYVGLNV